MHLSELNIYPIKSLHGIPLTEAQVEERGLKNDRCWMLVDENKRFITQREFPVMARMKVLVDDENLSVSFDGSNRTLPMLPAEGNTARVGIWSSNVKAEFYDDETNAWFSEAVGVECRLVAMPISTKRIVSPDYAVRRFQDIVSFADGYPFLLIGRASLDDLNARLDEPVPMNRFRPNFVVEGSEAFAEDGWKRIRIGDSEFHLVKPCGRCIITTVDQASGVRNGGEPLATLSGYRKKIGKVLFGQNLIAESPGGTVKVGDRIEVLETR